MNEATKVLLDHEPCPNVIDADEFHDRVAVIFKQIGEILARSAGPCGAPAIISQYPFHHITKDGFTIRKNISYEKSDGFLDQVIADLCGNICDRLNFAVGDGTTAAILVTCAMYDYYNEHKDKFDEVFMKPGDILKCMNDIKPDIIGLLEDKSTQISSLPLDEMVSYISKVVNISSNGDEELTKIICDIYKQIGYPAITVEMSDDGKMKSDIFTGYLAQVVLADALYVNNDNMTMDEKNCDVLIYDHKISLQTYENTLRPLAQMCKQRGRKLLCMAPFFDSTALPIISEDSMKEKRSTGSVSLVLMNYRNSGWLASKKIGDLAMLCGTPIINSYMDGLINEGMAAYLAQSVPTIPFEFDSREIPGNKICVLDTVNNSVKIIDRSEIIDLPAHERDKFKYVSPESERSFRVGYIGTVSAGLKKSIFKDFIINDTLYNLSLNEAKKDLDDAVAKYSNIGGFNVEVNQRQDRFMSLSMKMGTIHVGADTDFSRNFVKDVVDDCVKAAESAYRNGIIKGCHVTIMQALKEYKMKLINEFNKEEISENKYIQLTIITKMFEESYESVYKTIIENGISQRKDKEITDIADIDTIKEKFQKVFLNVPTIDNENAITAALWYVNHNLEDGKSVDIKDFIVAYSVVTGTVFDFNSMDFTNDVINSTATDREIFKSAIDLIGLLITGNQLIISRPN